MNWTTNTQTWLALAVGALALANVARRWWPGRRRAQGDAACGTPGAATRPSGGCSSGCGQCGNSAAPSMKDHRTGQPTEQVIHVVRPPRG